MSTSRETSTQPTDSAGPTSSSPTPKPHGDLEEYHRITDTIGGVPNLRWKDNLFQLLVVAIFTGVGGLLSWLLIPAAQMSTSASIVSGAAGGLILGTLLSGLVLMAMGWIRSGRKK